MLWAAAADDHAGGRRPFGGDRRDHRRAEVRSRPHWPGMLIAVAAAAAVTARLRSSRRDHRLEVRRHPKRPAGAGAAGSVLRENSARCCRPPSSFALLGAIESLLSAVVADGMTGRRHRSNCELVAQGAANIGSALFGGFCVTGTIARTATNVRAGAHGPVAGMLHAVFLLLFMLLAAPLAAFIPLAALAGVLVIVAWNMIEKAGDRRAAALRLGRCRRAGGDLLPHHLPRPDRGHRRRLRAGLGAVHPPHVAGDRDSDPPAFRGRGRGRRGGAARPYDETRSSDPQIVVYRITGAFFFGAAASIGSVLDRIPDSTRR